MLKDYFFSLKKWNVLRGEICISNDFDDKVKKLAPIQVSSGISDVRADFFKLFSPWKWRQFMCFFLPVWKTTHWTKQKYSNLAKLFTKMSRLNFRLQFNWQSWKLFCSWNAKASRNSPINERFYSREYANVGRNK